MSAVAQRVWNFVLTGECRSGAGAVAAGLSGRPGAVCHLGLFHPDPGVRREAHEAYFGASPDDAPEWLTPETNPWQYINHTVLDNPRRGETAVGFHIPYTPVRRYELYDLFEQRGREGDFSVIQVVRNPVACFVSLAQAEQSGVWTRTGKDNPPPPCPVRVLAADLVRFCRDHAATLAKVRAACDDRLEVSYADVVYDYQAAMRKVFDFVELDETPELIRPAVRRLRNRPVADRITNLTELRRELPTDVRQLLDADDLI